jgi:hypothetical protein
MTIINRDPGDETKYLDGGPEDMLRDVRVQNALGNVVVCVLCDEPVTDADWCEECDAYHHFDCGKWRKE